MGASKGSLGTTLGAVAGFAVGGPMGASIGAGLGGSIGGGMDAADAAEDAAKLQLRGTQAAIAEQQAARQQIAQQLAPYMGAGGAAQSQLLEILGIRDPARTAAYQQALAFKPQFSDKERRAIIMGGPTGMARGGGAGVVTGGGPETGATGRPGQMTTGSRAFGGVTAQVVGVIKDRKEAERREQRYQQAIAERDMLAKNRQLISQYESFKPSEQFGMLTRDVTQGLPSILPADIEKDTLFQSLKRQAISGIESSAAARGKLMSGTTPQAIAEQVQNLALGRAGQIQSQNVMARQALLGERIGEQERRYQQLFNLTGLGQASAAQQAANIQGAASNIGNLLTQGASAQAAGVVGAANAQNQMLQGLIGAGTTLGTAYMLRPPV